MTTPNRIVSCHLPGRSQSYFVFPDSPPELNIVPSVFIIKRQNDDAPRVYKTDNHLDNHDWERRLLTILRRTKIEHSVELIESTFWYSFWDIPPLGIAGDVSYDDFDV